MNILRGMACSYNLTKYVVNGQVCSTNDGKFTVRWVRIHVEVTYIACIDETVDFFFTSVG